MDKAEEGTGGEWERWENRTWAIGRDGYSLCFSLLFNKRVFLERDRDREGGSHGCRGGDEREEKGEQYSRRDVPASVMPH